MFLIKVTDSDIIKNHELFLKSYNSAGSSFLESNYISKAFPIIENIANRQYPYEVKLPKSLPELLQGDFEPSRIVTVKQPVKGLYSNMWFGDATSRCTLRCGYVDGNSSKMCTQTIGAEDIHMILGGATGQGKSVTLNSIIFGFCTEFAPWEIDLTLCDAKIVEFKSYALQHPMPHIRRIAATEDADYIISVLNTLKTEMTQWYSVFPIAGVKKIDDFRKVTGLCVPQHIIVVDEYQTMFKNAKKKLSTILDIIDAFARLGRATGFHLLLASQEMGSDIPKNMLANITIRAAMGCDAAVSELILGNDEAKNNKGKRGRLIINSKIEEGKAGNVQVRVPFMPDSERLALGKSIIDAAKQFNYETVLSFYDSEATIDEKDYKSYLEGFKRNNRRILLGEPSFVKEGEQIVSLDFTGKEIENLLVLAPALTNQERYFKMLKMNVERLGSTQNIIVCLNEIYNDICQAKDLAHGRMYTEEKNFDSDVMSVAFDLIARRKLCLTMDKYAFQNTSIAVNSDEFYKEFEHGSEYDTELNRIRFAAGLYVLKTTADLRAEFGIDNLVDSDSKHRVCLKKVSTAIIAVNSYGCMETMIDKSMFPSIFVWILGMDKMLGLGRDSKSRNVNRLKKALQDCTELGIRFIMFSNTMEDMADLKSGIRWVISDGAIQKDLTALRLSDDFPDQVGSGLGVLSDLLATSNKCIKFKKMRLDGEIFQ